MTTTLSEEMIRPRATSASNRIATLLAKSWRLPDIPPLARDDIRVIVADEMGELETVQTIVALEEKLRELEQSEHAARLARDKLREELRRIGVFWSDDEGWLIGEARRD